MGKFKRGKQLSIIKTERILLQEKVMALYKKRKEKIRSLAA